MTEGTVARLLDGSEVVLRLLTREDGEALKKFFSSLSREARQFLYDDVTDANVVEGWVRNVNYGLVLPIIADVNGEIVADATLHKRDFGPTRHVGRVRICIREDFLRRGLGTILTNEITALARARGLKLLSSMLAEGGEEAAIEVMEKAGFEKVATLPDYVMDLAGNTDNVILMVKRL